jgi:nitrate/nitrite transporter NarK
MSIFYCGSLISGAFGNLIAAGILKGLAGARGLAAWQWLYIIEGSITVVIGLFISVYLPDFPHTWKALSPELRHIANRRMAIEAAEADLDEEGGKSQVRGMKLAFIDPKTYILAVAYMSIVGAGGFQNYFPTLTATLGYSRTISLLLVAPPYIFMVFYSVAHCYLSDRWGNRFWFYMYPAPITIVGFVVFLSTDSFGPRYLSCFLFLFSATGVATTLSWASSSLPRPPAKRAVALAFINSIGNSASVWTPFTYRKQDSPHYVPAMAINIILECLSMVCGITLRWYLQRQNRELARLENEDVQLSEKDMRKLEKTAEMEGLDISSARRLQKGYRYML